MSAATQSTPVPKGKIAVIDDDRFIRYLLDLHLRKAGYEVFVAEDAMAAGRVILQCPPDLILCDVDMPLIFHTVNTSAGERAKQLGAGHLTKPVMADELVRTVAQFAPPSRR